MTTPLRSWLRTGGWWLVVLSLHLAEGYQDFLARRTAGREQAAHRSQYGREDDSGKHDLRRHAERKSQLAERGAADAGSHAVQRDRKSTRLNSSHLGISYAVFCLKKKNT